MSECESKTERKYRYVIFHGEDIRSKKFQIEKIVCRGVFSKIRKLWVSLLGGDLVIKCHKT